MGTFILMQPPAQALKVMNTLKLKYENLSLVTAPN